MSEKTRKILITVFILTALCLIGAWQRSKPTFRGTRAANPDGYLLNFEEMNREDAHSMRLDADSQLKCQWEIEKGTVDILIQDKNSEVIYRGNKLDTADFLLDIKEYGVYTVTVKARNARGYVRVVVAQ